MVDAQKHISNAFMTFMSEATQQAKASDSITKTMQKVGKVSEHNSAISRQTAVAIKRLSVTSAQLATSVDAFKLDKPAEPQPEQSVDA